MKNGTKVAGGTYWKQNVELANVVMHGVKLTNNGKITAACVALLKEVPEVCWDEWASSSKVSACTTSAGPSQRRKRPRSGSRSSYGSSSSSGSSSGSESEGSGSGSEGDNE